MAHFVYEKLQTQNALPVRLHLEYLDGLRGLAALFIVLYHAYQEIYFSPDLPVLSQKIFIPCRVLWQGPIAVTTFIVLSGYCLMLPVARSKAGQLRDGFGGYIRRRAWRILPPYYAALIFSLLLIALVPGLHTLRNMRSDAKLPAFTPSVLVSHFALLHNLSNDWVWKINCPLWSVATEWQIYFIFGLILLPCWRRIGIVATTLLAVIVSAMPWLCGKLSNMDHACFWYIGLFSMGMAAAVINFSPDIKSQWSAKRFPYGRYAFIFGLMFLFTLLGKKIVHLPHSANSVLTDIVLGLFFSSLLIHYTQKLQAPDVGKLPPLLRFLSSPPLVGIGLFSYSLYLTHFLLLSVTHDALLAMPLAPLLRCLLMLLGAPLACIAFAYGFYLIFERPFTTAKSGRKPLPLAVATDA